MKTKELHRNQNSFILQYKHVAVHLFKLTNDMKLVYENNMLYIDTTWIRVKETLKSVKNTLV